MGLRDMGTLLIYTARSNRCHPPFSPNIAPATKNHSHDTSSFYMKRPLQCAEQQDSPSNITKFCACHENDHPKCDTNLPANAEISSAVVPSRPLVCEVLI